MILTNKQKKESRRVSMARYKGKKRLHKMLSEANPMGEISPPHSPHFLLLGGPSSSSSSSFFSQATRAEEEEKTSIKRTQSILTTHTCGALSINFGKLLALVIKNVILLNN